MAFVIVILLSLGLRLLLLGDQPYSDEGVYAGMAYLLHLAYTGNLGPDGWYMFKDEALGLYPLLSSNSRRGFQPRIHGGLPFVFS